MTSDRLNAELALLGAILIDDALPIVRPQLAQADFQLRPLRLLYERVLAMSDAGEPISPISVTEAMTAAGELVEAGRLWFGVILLVLIEAASMREELDAHLYTVKRGMSLVTYHDYLLSPKWQQLRDRVRERSGGRCERCRTGSHEHTHHLTYERTGDERLEDLLGVCADCHASLHAEASGDARRVDL